MHILHLCVKIIDYDDTLQEEKGEEIDEFWDSDRMKRTINIEHSTFNFEVRRLSERMNDE